MVASDWATNTRGRRDPQFRGTRLQQFPQSIAHRTGGLFAAANESVERWRFKIFAIAAEVIEQAHCRHISQIQNVLTDGHAGAGAAVSSGKDAKRQVLNREVRIGRNADPTGQLWVIHFKHVRKLRRYGGLTCRGFVRN